jgi:acetyl esterase/lipase
MSGAVWWSRAWAQEDRRVAKLTPAPRPARLPDAWTAAPTIPLWPGDPPGAAGFAAQKLPADWPAVFVRNIAKPALHVFRPDRPDGRALLVIPGGAYQFVSVANEGADLAARVTPLGITVFVLTYRLPGEGWAARADVPLQDAQRAMRVMRAEAARYEIDPSTVALLGFSAGGHLAATLATQHAEHVYDAVDSRDALSARPFAAALVYPVVTMLKPWTHGLSRNLLLGETATDADVERRSAELHVDAATPPLFIVHAIDDEAVPVENSIRLMEAARAARVQVEAHFLQEGGHAFGVGYPHTPSEHWIELLDVWWRRLGAAGPGNLAARRPAGQSKA